MNSANIDLNINSYTFDDLECLENVSVSDNVDRGEVAKFQNVLEDYCLMDKVFGVST